MIEIIIHILFLIVFVYLSINTLYLFIAAVAAKFYSRNGTADSPGKLKIAILIPTYNEDEVIINTVRTAAEHNYSKECFDVFVAAHHLSQQTIEALHLLPVNVSVVDFERGSKARSLNYLLNKIDENKYDVALILDGDNLIMPGVLDKINTAFSNGANCVQVHRTAKNRNMPLAILDALSEEINNTFFRKGQQALGLSAALIGSGMAFRFNKLKEIYNKPGILDNPACDREVDFEMMKSNIPVVYIEEVYVLDEKVSKNKVFENQRRRWMESQLMHLRLFFTDKVEVKTKDYWNKLFINLIPPRALMLIVFGILFVICLLQYFLERNITGINLRWWASLFIVYGLAMFMAIPASFYTIRTLKAVIHLPSILFTYLKAATGLRSRRKEFVHTPKTFTGEKKL